MHANIKDAPKIANKKFILTSILLVLSSTPTTLLLANDQGIRIEGTVLSDQGQPLPYAQVLCFDGPTKLSLTAQPVGPNGSFNLKFPQFRGTHVLCEFSARGFSPQKITLIVEEDVAKLGSLRLRKLKSIKPNDLSVTYSGDGRFSYLDVFLTNEASIPLEVTRIEVIGTARSRTTCLDLTPEVIFTVSPTLMMLTERENGTPVDISVPAKQWNDQVLAEGRIEVLPCDQFRLNLNVPSTTFSLDASERKKIRLAVPRILKASSGTLTKADLREWEVLTVRFTLGSGQIIESAYAH